jgi:UDP-N-acetylenolpyruvoylglucosamine reductase
MISSKSWPCAALARAELAARTTMHVGGAAEWLLEPTTPEELRRAIVAAREEGCEPRILGGGANLIVADGVLPGVVITTERMQRLFRPEPDEVRTVLDDSGPLSARARPLARDEGLRFVAWSGVTLPKLVSSTAKLGWKGLEGLIGVPGNTGGGIAMNAGGRWGEMWDVVERVLVVDERGELRELAREDCAPAYRNGRLGRSIVASAVLRFELDVPADVAARGREYLKAKNEVQPVTEWSAGCVFQNPDRELSGGRSAGMLVEQCGGKGRTRGDAIVSPLHGNFVVNRGHATASDVLGLIEEVHDLVAQKTGIDLVREVKVWSPQGAGP